MKLVVAIQLVPDLVEELVIAPEGATLDPDTVRWVISEFDDYAIEQAILLKERHGGTVTVVAPAQDGVDDALFSAAARGADVLVKLSGEYYGGCNNHALSRIFAPVIQAMQPDLVLTGVQAHHQNDGALGPLLAEALGLPYVGYVAGVKVEGAAVIVRKEYPGGLTAEIEAALPAALGIQTPDTPPRYVPISKIRQAMKTSKVQEEDAGELDGTGGVTPSRMFTPEAGGHAQMISGDVEQVAAALVALFKQQGLL